MQAQARIQVVAARGSAASSVRCQAAAKPAAAAAPAVSRRQASALLFTAATLAPAVAPQPSHALLDFDEDEELLARTKAARATKLKSELKAERSFASEEGFTKQTAEVGYVQKAVVVLSKGGAALANGDVATLSSTVGDGEWVGNLQKAASVVGKNAVATEAAPAMFSSIKALQKSAAAGQESAAKKDYVTTVKSLSAWVSAAGLDSSIKGL
mmetsp:Transcript_13108/g.43182  ORF Transcript_13108/g.43182 Transcript_13108/m.43182 type:complete len:212 (-) Transcript_13108:185-820(-)